MLGERYEQEIPRAGIYAVIKPLLPTLQICATHVGSPMASRLIYSLVSRIVV
jgi:hypothetical protein